jgi:hypothetical protein
MQVLSPEGKNQHFRRFVAALLALPRRYMEEIENYNARNPASPFIPQTGPIFTLYRLQLGTLEFPNQTAPNMNLQTIIDLFIQNHIPPEWVEHIQNFHGHPTDEVVLRI